MRGFEVAGKWATDKERSRKDVLRNASGDVSLVECLECGRRFHRLAMHVYAMHGKSIDAYLRDHRLPMGYRVTSNSHHEKLAQRIQAAMADKPERFSAAFTERMRSKCTDKRYEIRAEKAAGRPVSDRQRRYYSSGSPLQRSRQSGHRKLFICAQCGQIFERPVSQRRSAAACCSRSCALFFRHHPVPQGESQ